MTDSEKLQQLIETTSSSLHELLEYVEAATDRLPILLQLKEQADSYWGVNERVSLLIAHLMMGLGEAVGDQTYKALGRMAYGDVLRFLTRIHEAHQVLQEAGDLFLAIPNEVGWARTRIGRLLTSEAFGGDEVSAALEELQTAKKIFTRGGHDQFLMRLLINLNAFHIRRSEFEAARKCLESGMELVGGAQADVHRAKLLHNLGIVEHYTGHDTEAETYFQEAIGLFEQFAQPRDAADVQASWAAMLVDQGKYRDALEHLQACDARLGKNNRTVNRINTMVCYQMLGAPERAIAIAKQMINGGDELQPLDRASVHMRWGDSLSALENHSEAIDKYSKAEEIYKTADAQAKVLEVYVRRATIRLRIKKDADDDLTKAEADDELAKVDADVRHALDSEDIFVLTSANIVLGLLALRRGQIAEARTYAVNALRLARADTEDQRFKALMFAGHVREAETQLIKALSLYQRIHARVLTLRRDLIRDFRPQFLEKNQAALHGAIRVALHQQNVHQALQFLEQMKALVVAENLEQAPSEAYSGRVSADNTADQLETTFDQLPSDVGIIEYYSDGHKLYAFTFSRESPIQVTLLTADHKKAFDLTHALRRSMGRAAALGADKAWQMMGEETHSFLKALHDVLFSPVERFLQDYGAAIIIPFGFLHAVPFHLLHNGQRYRIEDQAITIAPASVMLTRSGETGRQGALALGYSGAKTHSAYRMEKEAEAIARMLGGTAHTGEAATSGHLLGNASQILHIAAHGKSHWNQPRLSCLRLADRRVYMDDLRQFDLRYGLVTLSACSVGLGYASGGDELIGLGHSFLYGGAAALVSSLWEVDDAAAAAFYQGFYSHLQTGMSKTGALRSTQMALMQEARFRHPAYWGAFQLIGNPSPLFIDSPIPH